MGDDLRAYARWRRGEVLARCLRWRAMMAKGNHISPGGYRVTAAQVRQMLRRDQALLVRYRHMIQTGERARLQ